MDSRAESVEEYLDALPPDRAAALGVVRNEILAHLPAGVVETVAWGMVAYEVPLATFPSTYNGKPLLFAGLASQRRHMAVYLQALYGDEQLAAWFTDSYRASGKRMDLGKSCVRFRTLDDLPLQLIGEAIGAATLQQFIALHERGASLRQGRQ